MNDSQQNEAKPKVEPKDVVSPEIRADGIVTFRILAPNAGKVTVQGDFGKPCEMTKDANGLWTTTVGPLKAQVYSYSFLVDDVPTLDPRNPDVKRYVPVESVVEVPGNPPMPWEKRAVRHGAVHVHWYDSKSLGVQRRMHVYTPPDYEEGRRQYPVLYLLHGWGDDDSGWTSVGRANFILDSLIAEGKAKPMIVVMPYGHTFDPFAVKGPIDGEKSAREIEQDLIEEVIPFIRSNYYAMMERPNRAICGLSMGGWQSLRIGLGNPDRFAWVGAFSTGMMSIDEFKGLLPKDRKPELLWIGCGRDDRGFAGSQAMVEAAKSAGLNPIWRPSEGGHAWPVWRGYLAGFAPLLFR